jgi:hypothetical protein
VLKALSFVDQAETHTIDYNPWSDTHGSVTTVTATLKSGTATISNESLSANIKTLTITTPQAGQAMIKLTATAGLNTDTTYLYIYTKDPDANTSDYGLCG